MSSRYRRVRDRNGGPDTFVERGYRKPYSPAWQAARAARRERRKGLQEQPRNSEGFILKKDTTGVYLYDPGEIDRFVWRNNSGRTLV
jgi:hypothetical protein